jgi:hypothetical protein
MPNIPTTTRRTLLTSGLVAGVARLLPTSGLAATIAQPASTPAGNSDRTLWLDFLQRVSEPVLSCLSRRELRAKMPIEAVAGQQRDRAIVSPLEATGRLLAGLAPWLELDTESSESSQETTLRARYRSWALQAIESVVDPASPDYMHFAEADQTLVDSSFLALALLRSPRQLFDPLDKTTRTRLVSALVKTREMQIHFNNWLLFAALNEATLRLLGATWDRMRVDYALRQLQTWYLGDGTYSDGPQFHADFYNSIVIHPYLLQLMDTISDADPEWKAMHGAITRRAQRQAAIQERMISPTGEYPVLGRSITYRGGVFHLLADAARRQILPSHLLPQQVRSALTATQQRTLTSPGTFTTDGWLQIGIAGHQPSLGEGYISTGSLYLCSNVWLPLGLPSSNSFWSAPYAPWTQVSAWSGNDIPADHAAS